LHSLGSGQLMIVSSNSLCSVSQPLYFPRFFLLCAVAYCELSPSAFDLLDHSIRIPKPFALVSPFSFPVWKSLFSRFRIGAVPLFRFFCPCNPIPVPPFFSRLLLSLLASCPAFFFVYLLPTPHVGLFLNLTVSRLFPDNQIAGTQHVRAGLSYPDLWPSSLSF